MDKREKTIFIVAVAVVVIAFAAVFTVYTKKSREDTAVPSVTSTPAAEATAAPTAVPTQEATATPTPYETTDITDDVGTLIINAPGYGSGTYTKSCFLEKASSDGMTANTLTLAYAGTCAKLTSTMQDLYTDRYYSFAADGTETSYYKVDDEWVCTSEQFELKKWFSLPTLTPGMMKNMSASLVDDGSGTKSVFATSDFVTMINAGFDYDTMAALSGGVISLQTVLANPTVGIGIVYVNDELTSFSVSISNYATDDAAYTSIIFMYSLTSLTEEVTVPEEAVSTAHEASQYELPNNGTLDLSADDFLENFDRTTLSEEELRELGWWVDPDATPTPVPEVTEEPEATPEAAEVTPEVTPEAAEVTPEAAEEPTPEAQGSGN